MEITAPDSEGYCCVLCRWGLSSCYLLETLLDDIVFYSKNLLYVIKVLLLQLLILLHHLLVLLVLQIHVLGAVERAVGGKAEAIPICDGVAISAGAGVWVSDSNATSCATISRTDLMISIR